MCNKDVPSGSVGLQPLNNMSPRTIGLPPPPPFKLHQAQSSTSVNLVRPTSTNLSPGHNHVNEDNCSSTNIIPGLNIYVDHKNEDNNEDKELDDLLCSFQRILQNANSDGQNGDKKKRKNKQKKKKLMVGRNCLTQVFPSQETEGNHIDDEAATRNIVEQLGFSYGKGNSNRFMPRSI